MSSGYLCVVSLLNGPLPLRSLIPSSFTTLSASPLPSSSQVLDYRETKTFVIKVEEQVSQVGSPAAVAPQPGPSARPLSQGSPFPYLLLLLLCGQELLSLGQASQPSSHLSLSPLRTYSIPSLPVPVLHIATHAFLFLPSFTPLPSFLLRCSTTTLS